MLKNIVLEGYNFEKNMSLQLHGFHSAVLVSSLLLRELSLGQIDVSIIKKNYKSNMIVLYECKRNTFPSRVQLKRLLKTADYLSRVLSMEVKIEVIFAKSNKLNYP